jgi:hypothetical protein
MYLAADYGEKQFMLAPIASGALYPDIVSFSSARSALVVFRLKMGLIASMVVYGIVAITALICIASFCAKSIFSSGKDSTT